MKHTMHILILLLFTGCMSSKTRTIGVATNNPSVVTVDFDTHDTDLDGVITRDEFPKTYKNTDATIAGEVIMIIIGAVIILTFGLFMMTCSRKNE